MAQKIPRRDVLVQGGALAAIALGVGASACGRRALLVCSDTSSLTPAELAARNTLAYADQSPDPTRVCSGCKQFLPRGPHECGSCKVVKGPINPFGSCKSFVSKNAPDDAGTPA